MYNEREAILALNDALFVLHDSFSRLQEENVTPEVFADFLANMKDQYPEVSTLKLVDLEKDKKGLLVITFKLPDGMIAAAETDFVSDKLISMDQELNEIMSTIGPDEPLPTDFFEDGIQFHLSTSGVPLGHHIHASIDALTYFRYYIYHDSIRFETCLHDAVNSLSTRGNTKAKAVFFQGYETFQKFDDWLGDEK